MSKVRVAAFSVSIDGFGAGPRQDINNPLGVRGLELHGWFQHTEEFKKMQGQSGGSRGVDNDAPRNLSKMSAPGSWAGICSARFEVPGKTIPGKGGGATILRTTLPFLCSRIMHGLPS
jgi:hypothetical protein